MEHGRAPFPRIEFTIESDLGHVFLAGLAVRGICGGFFRNELDVFNIELCVVEALNNAIKHSYSSERGHQIDLHVAVSQNGLTVELRDSGKELHVGGKPALDFDPASMHSLPEGGMGMFIIYSLMDEVSYTVRNGMNVLSMTKLFDANPESDKT